MQYRIGKFFPLSLNTRRALVSACLIVPVLFGFYSVWLGADTNWDLFNYHLYNAYAFLNQRLDIDLAPAGMQSYFNPLLDLSYYEMSVHWPARLVGFVMGCVQGANFVLLLLIARKTLPDLPAEDRYRVPLFIAAAGCLTTNFLSELGTSMGDNVTALFELGALLIVLSWWNQLRAWSGRTVAIIVVAGLISGLGAGLKLTNIVYAVALGAGFLVLPFSPWVRLRLAFLLGLGFVLGLGLTGGFWFLEMRHRYGNPLFPQFSAIFPNPLTNSINVADIKWHPRGLLETLLWPFVLTLDPHRVNQLVVVQVIWSIVYLLMLSWAAVVLHRKLGRREDPGLESRQRYVLAYVGIGFVVWMELFSIYRYIVPIELVAPLAVFILFTRIFPYARGRRFAVWTLSGAALIVLAGGVRTWGHAAWDDPVFQAETPALAAPSSTTVLVVGHDPDLPHAWLALFFPREVAFIGLHVNFPESPVYVARAHAMVKDRGGPVYTLVEGHTDKNTTNRDAIAVAVTRWFDLAATDRGCSLLSKAVEKLKLHMQLRAPANPGSGARCELVAPPVDVPTLDHTSAVVAADTLANYRFALDTQSCKRYMAYVGKNIYPYQWCQVVEGAKAVNAKSE